MGGCIGAPRDGSSPNGESSDGTGGSEYLLALYSVSNLTFLVYKSSVNFALLKTQLQSIF